MDRSPYAPMLPSSEAPNPLRPYYRPPSIGVTSTTGPNNTSPSGLPTSSTSSAAGPSFGSTARNIISDLNYNEFLGEAVPTTSASMRSLLDQLVWKYSSVFLAQPLEVAKMVLQVRFAEAAVDRGSSESASPRYGCGRQQHTLNDDDEEDEDDEPSYFTSTAPQQTSPSRRQSARYRPSPPRTPASQAPSSRQPHKPPYKLELRNTDSVWEVVSQLWSREGSWGLWKGTNVTFLHSLLLKAIETWMRSMLSAVFNLPDPGMLSVSSASVGGLDIIDSPSPLASLGVAVVAAGVAGLVLAPLDIVRTRIILTPTIATPRTVLATLRALPSYLCPANLVAPTLLHATIPAIFSGTTPLLLRSNLHIDPILTPSTYSVATFLASSAELFSRLPVETVLRRGQMQSVLQHDRLTEVKSAHARSRSNRSRQCDYDYNDDEDLKPPRPPKRIDTVVEIGPYTGVIASMWRIAREEGETIEQVPQAKASQPQRPTARPKKGQGMQGLWRGWRVGMWGLVGVWGAAALGPAGKGGEF